MLARLLERATARPVCDALGAALARHGVPQAILTDNGKVFTARFGPGPEPVLFDRVCHEQAQAALDAWVVHYNTARPHQGIGDRPSADRFALAAQSQARVEVAEPAETSAPEPALALGQPAGLLAITRRVADSGRISLAGVRYLAGRWLAGELVQVALHDGLVEISHRGVLVASHASHHRPGTQPAIRRAPVARPPRPATSGVTVTRIADPGGTVSFAGAGYYAGWAYRGQQVQVTLVADTVQLAVAGRVIKVHPIRHDPAKEHGAFATPNGRPRRRGPGVA